MSEEEWLESKGRTKRRWILVVSSCGVSGAVLLPLLARMELLGWSGPIDTVDWLVLSAIGFVFGAVLPPLIWLRWGD